MEIHIPAATIPFLVECDVLVCGGGCSGIVAAVSAARHGASRSCGKLLSHQPCLHHAVAGPGYFRMGSKGGNNVGDGVQRAFA